jgi:subtilisin family serine protease
MCVIPQAQFHAMADQLTFTLPTVTRKSIETNGITEVIDWGIRMMGIPQLWRLTKGEGVKVAVLDTGIAYNHPDLKDTILDMKDFTNSPGGPMDAHGHGTHVAGTIAARENSSGVIGTAPLSKLLVGRVLGDNGNGSSSMVAAGIYWAIEKGADIISMSLGSPQYSKEIHEAVIAAYRANIFVIAAAGNEGPRLDTINFPAKLPETISVGSIDRELKVSRFSSRGDRVDIVAPGDNILSCYPPNTLATLSGTSMATPLVSGVAALMVARHRMSPSESPLVSLDDLKKHLHETAIDIGPKGIDKDSGYGIINPKDLLGDTGVPPAPKPTPAPTPTPVTPPPTAPIADLELNLRQILSAEVYDKVVASLGQGVVGKKVTVTF